MPPKKVPKPKTPPRKKPTPRKKGADVADDIAGDFANMSVAPAENAYNKEVKFAFMQYSHLNTRGRRILSVESFVPTLPNNFFRAIVSPCGTKLLFSVRLPNTFTAEDRQSLAFYDDANFNNSTHQNTAYKKIAQRINEDHDDGSDDLYIWSDPQEIPLLFKCEEELRWEVQMHLPIPEVATLTEELGGEQFTAIFAAKLTSVEKPKTRQRGGVRVVGRRAEEDDNMEEGDDASM